MFLGRWRVNGQSGRWCDGRIGQLAMQGSRHTLPAAEAEERG
jgi:hypothetical protein